MTTQVPLARVALVPCGNCGARCIGMRVRTAKRGLSTAQAACTMCGARGQLISGDAGRAVDEAVRLWNSRPVAEVPIAPSRAGAAAPSRSGPDTARDPLVLLARMVVSGSYRVPVQGRATTAPLTAADVAHALGMMRDPLAKAAALAVALRAEGVDLARFGRLALHSVARMLRSLQRSGVHVPLSLDDPADRWRLRLVLQDAADDLVWPERKRASGEAAKAVKMRKGDYLVVYRIASGTVRQALEDARREFCIRLFSAG